MRTAAGITAIIVALFLAVPMKVGADVPEIGLLTVVVRPPMTTNVTDRSFTVTWVTDTTIPGSGQVIYGPNTSSVHTLAREIQPAMGSKGDVHTVNIALPSSSPNSTYYYALSNSSQIDNNGGSYYTVKLGATLVAPTSNRQASGRVLQADGVTPAASASVTVQLRDDAGLNGSTSSVTSAAVSTTTNSAGYWGVSLYPRTVDGSKLFNYNTNGVNAFLQYNVDGGSLGLGTQTVVLSLDNNGQITVPTINLSVGAATLTAVAATQSATSTVTTTAQATSTSTGTVTPVILPTSTTVASSTPVPPPVLPTRAGQSPTVAPNAPATPAVNNAPTPEPSPIPTFLPTPLPTVLAVIPTLLASSTPLAPTVVPSDTPVGAPTIATTPYPFAARGSASPGPGGGFGGVASPAAGGSTEAGIGPPTATTARGTVVSSTETAAEAADTGGGLPSLVTVLLLASFGLLGLGSCLVIYGLASQRLRGD